MKIIGYSERGAMNALFYGIANDENNGEDNLKKILGDLAGIEGEFHDFVIYNEFSLSEFGNPDMMIRAKDRNKDVLFFIEAKASCCEKYDLANQKKYHDNYIGGEDKYRDGHSSNLFFQLRLKHYFFQLRNLFYGEECVLKNKQESLKLKDPYNRLKKSRSRYRTIGNNVVVKRVVNEIRNCQKAYYIAIIPKQPQKSEISNAIDKCKKEYGFPIHIITWEDVIDTFDGYIGDTIRFNQGITRQVNQVLNNNRKFHK